MRLSSKDSFTCEKAPGNISNLQSSTDEDAEKIVDELPLEELYGFEEQEMIEEESVLVTDASDYAFVSVVASLRGVFVRVCAQ